MALSRRAAVVAALGLFGVASAMAFALILPVRTGQVGYDSTASVLYFDRLMAGQQLEAFISATPKPALTVIFGVAHTLTDDWRPLSWLTIAAFATSVVLAAILAVRLQGLAAGAFAAFAIMGLGLLVRDVALAYSVPWAMLGWLVAGLAVSRAGSPRYLLAGMALLFAALCRFETLIVVGLALVVLVVLSLAAIRRPELRPQPTAWLVLVAAAALPIQMLHDWLLTGDPMWSQVVPVAASVGAPLIGAAGVLRWTIERYLEMGPLLFLAGLGVIRLVRDRRWAILLGLAALGPGVIAFLVFLGWRGTYVSYRYFLPADVVLAFTAAIGFGALRVQRLVEGFARDRSRVKVATTIAVGVVGGICFAAPFAPFDPEVRTTIRRNLTMNANADRAVPVLDTALDTMPGVRDVPQGATARPGTSAGDPALMVPVLLRPRLAVDLDLPLTSIVGTSGKSLTTDGSYPEPGQLVYHDPRGDDPDEAFAFLEVEQPTDVGAIRLVPLQADPVRMHWAISIERR